MNDKYFYFGDHLPQVLTREEEKALLEDRENPKAMEELVTRNLRLVIHISKKFQLTGISNSELFSIGVLGLIKGLKTYRPEKKTQLTTYISKCIENEILMSLRKEKKWKNLDSLNEILQEDSTGQKLHLEDLVMDKSDDKRFIERLETLDVLSKTLTIALNKLKDKEKIILLLNLSGKKQKEIAKELKISQSYVSRVLLDIYQKNKEYSSKSINYYKKYRYILICTEEKYEFGILMKDFLNIKMNISNFLKNINMNEKIINKISFKEKDGYLIITLPKVEDSFSFISNLLVWISHNN